MSGIQASFFTDVRSMGASGVDWLSTNASKLKASGSEALAKVWAAASSFFSNAAVKIGAFLNAGKDIAINAFGKAKEAFKALPTEWKVASGVVAAAGVLLAVYSRLPASKAAEKKEGVEGEQQMKREEVKPEEQVQVDALNDANAANDN